MRHRCASCFLSKEEEKLQKCSACRSTFYCGKECQTRDWSIHKIFCGLPTTVKESEGGSSDTEVHVVQALLFPHDSKKPRFVDLSITRTDTDGNIKASELIRGENLQLQQFSTEPYSPIFNSEDYKVPCGLHFIRGVSAVGGFKDSSLPENKSMQTLLKGKAKAMFSSPTCVRIMGDDYWKTQAMEKVQKWKGDILVVKSNKYHQLNLKRPTYQDMTMVDTIDVAMFAWILSGNFKRYNGLIPGCNAKPSFVHI